MRKIYLLPFQHSSYFCDQTNNRFTVSKTNIWAMRWRVWGTASLSIYPPAPHPKQEGKPHNEESLVPAANYERTCSTGSRYKVRHSGSRDTTTRGRLRDKGCWVCGEYQSWSFIGPGIQSQCLIANKCATTAQRSWEYDITLFEFSLSQLVLPSDSWRYVLRFFVFVLKFRYFINRSWTISGSKDSDLKY